MGAITDFLSGINIWLAVVLVDGTIGLIIYAGYIAYLNLRYSMEVYFDLTDPENYMEKGDIPDGEDANWYRFPTAGEAEPGGRKGV